MKGKDELRQIVRNREVMYNAIQKAEVSERIMEAIEQLPVFEQAENVLLYWSLPTEVATHRHVQRWAVHKRIYLPVMQGHELVLRRFTERSVLEERRFGILEPVTGEEITPDRVNLMVVPAVGYDTLGNRLGHGKGFYDRLLTSESPLKIGICFDYQLFDQIPVEPHDIPVDWVICGSSQEVKHYRNGILHIP